MTFFQFFGGKDFPYEISIWAKVGWGHMMSSSKLAKGTNVQTHRGNLCGHRGLKGCGCWKSIYGATPNHMKIWWINVFPGVLSTKYFIVFPKLRKVSKSIMDHNIHHESYSSYNSSNILNTHECKSTVPSSTRWRLVMMEWVASTRARISSKSTFTASIAAVKSCPQQ